MKIKWINSQAYVIMALIILGSFSLGNTNEGETDDHDAHEEGHEDHEDHEDHGHEDHDHEEDEHDHDAGDYFHLLVDLSNSGNEAGLDQTALDFILAGLNVSQQCINSSTLLTFQPFADPSVIGEDDFLKVAPEIIKYLINDGCDLLNVVPNPISPCRPDLKMILDKALQNNKWTPAEDAQQCFSTSDLLPTGECSYGDSEPAIQAYAHMFTSMLSGECMLPDAEDFNQKIIELTDADADGRITETELVTMLGSFSVASEAEDDHAGHDHGEEEGHDDVVVVTNEETEEDDDHDHEEGEDHDHDRKKRSEDDDEAKCYTADDYLSIAGYTKVDDVAFINADDLAKIYPVIIEQVMTSACTADSHDDHATTTSAGVAITDAQKWGYAVAANLIISLLAFIGLLVFRSYGSASFDMVLQFFIALGIGTLSGDALLHLLPQIVGLHAEHGTDEAHDHDAEEESLDYVWKLLVVVGGIYLFFLFENGLKLWNRVNGTNISLHHHEGNDHHHRSPQTNGKAGHNHHNHGGVENGGFEHDDGDAASKNEKEEHGEEKEPQKVYIWGLNAVGLMVLCGDALHNLADGLAIGVAFSSSWVSGLGTTLAIFCHELPHEFGDFAIYLNNGATRWKALFLNFIAACCSFVGLFIGLALGTNTGYTQWLMAVIAGMFIYISLVNIMQEMSESVSNYPITQFCVQNLGLLLGWAIMLLLALYEEALMSAIAG